MREIRTSGSEGGGADSALPTPIMRRQIFTHLRVRRSLSKRRPMRDCSESSNCEDGSPEPSGHATSRSDGSGDPSSQLVELIFMHYKVRPKGYEELLRK
jgi:hypothetical protein